MLTTPTQAETADRSVQPQAGKGVFEDIQKPTDAVETQMPTEDFPSLPLMKAKTPPAPYDNVNPAQSAFQPMPGSVPPTTRDGMVLPNSARTLQSRMINDLTQGK
jgi:hypothetical protein